MSRLDHFHGMSPSPRACATTAFAETSSNMLSAIVGTIGMRCAALAKPSARAASVACANCPATACAPVGRPRPMSASTTRTGSSLPGRWVSAISTRCEAVIAALAAVVRATKSNGCGLALMAWFLMWTAWSSSTRSDGRSAGEVHDRVDHLAGRCGAVARNDVDRGAVIVATTRDPCRYRVGVVFGSDGVYTDPERRRLRRRGAGRPMMALSLAV